MADRIPITPQGHEKLKSELHRLKTEERPRAIREIEAARAHGDLSENAEYDAAKEKQGHLEGRIAQMEDRSSGTRRRRRRRPTRSSARTRRTPPMASSP
jgi:transcription elongation factor GreA